MRGFRIFLVHAIFILLTISVSAQGGNTWNGLKEKYLSLSRLDSASGKYELAFEHYKLYLIYRDSLQNEISTKNSQLAKLRYEFSKNEACQKAAQDKKNALSEADRARKSITLIFAGCGLLLVIVFLIFMFNRFRVAQKQKAVIETQKYYVEEKQKEILDSIHYAKRIQTSLLPTEKYIDRSLDRLRQTGIFLLLFFACHQMNAQQSVLDSLITVSKICKADSDKVNLLDHICYEFVENGDYESALDYENQALLLAQQIHFTGGEANILNGLGYIYYDLGNYPEALNYFFEALKIGERTGNKIIIATNNNDIGNVYDDMGNNKQALSYYQVALKLFEEVGLKQKIAASYNNLGIVYEKAGQLDLAISCHQKSMDIKKEIGYKKGIPFSLLNLGNVYLHQNRVAEAMNCFTEAEILWKADENKRGISMAFSILSKTWFQKGDWKNSKLYADSSLMVALEIGAMEITRTAYRLRAQADSAQGDFLSTYADYKSYAAYNDSLVNDDNTRKAAQTQMLYEFNKKKIRMQSEQDKKDVIESADKHKKNIILIFAIAGIFSVIGFTIFIFRRFRLTQQQKILIENQKLLIEEKQREVLDSIYYARRIQQSLLPTENYIRKNLSKHRN
jgi:tetratricopeptide (TPR) repeat protein